MKSADEYRLRVGELVGGRYQVERPLGDGGMGEVYAAFHVGTLARVALKLVNAAGGTDDAERLLREARTATAVKHLNVVKVSDLFEDHGSPVMVMELLQGESLAAYEAREGPLEPGDAAAILRQVAEGLTAAHALGVVHRDLKPENIFLTTDANGQRCAKILDFGIAKVLDPERLGILTRHKTTTGMMIGTVPYMSREQIMGDATVDTRTDIWSFGVVFWEALHGRRPLQFSNLAQMVTLFMQAKSPRARAVMPKLPKDIADLLDACLRLDPRDRLGDIGVAVDVLGAHLGLSTGSEESSRRIRPRRDSRRLAALAGVAVVASGAGAIWHFERSGLTWALSSSDAGRPAVLANAVHVDSAPLPDPGPSSPPPSSTPVIVPPPAATAPAPAHPPEPASTHPPGPAPTHPVQPERPPPDAGPAPTHHKMTTPRPSSSTIPSLTPAKTVDPGSYL